VRGLKYDLLIESIRSKSVAPHVGAWIEITIGALIDAIKDVAPHVGAWIEIKRSRLWSPKSRSHLT